MKIRILILQALLIVGLSGCGPSDTKTLLRAQAEYFDTAIEVVSMQSEALILTATKLIAVSGEKIDAKEAALKARYNQLIKSKISQTTAQKILDLVSSNRAATLARKAELNQDLENIKKKTTELNLYIIRMKEVHQTLLTHIDSTYKGQVYINQELKFPSIYRLLQATNTMMPEVEGVMNEIRTLLERLGG